MSLAFVAIRPQPLHDVVIADCGELAADVDLQTLIEAQVRLQNERSLHVVSVGCCALMHVSALWVTTCPGANLNTCPGVSAATLVLAAQHG